MKLRPHHLLCTQSYAGRGYSPDFEKNMDALTAALRANPATAVEIVFSTDDVCRACPKMLGENLCEFDERVNRFDSKVVDYFGLEQKSYIYREIVSEINAKMTLEIMDDICGECGWYRFGGCQQIILGVD